MNTIIEKIRAEIERRIKSWSTRGENSPEGQGKDTCVSRVTELTDLLSFLDTLEKEEKPMNHACESKFKVGDVIQFKDGINQYKICGVFSDHYINSIGNRMDKSYTDANFELVEQPVCEGLEEEIRRYIEPISPSDIQSEPFTQMERIARHFYELGRQNEYAKVKAKSALDKFMLENCTHCTIEHCPGVKACYTSSNKQLQ